MVKHVALLITLFSFLQAYAQDAADTVKLKELRQFPKKNSLPVRPPSLPIQSIEIPVDDLHLKVNYWRNWMSFGANINQGTFSNNWSGGGVSSVAIGGLFNYKTDYTRGDKNFVTEIALQYGKMKNKNQLERKTNDRIFWDNKIGTKLSKHWSFFASLNFESQFDVGFSYSKNRAGEEVRTLISRFMSPGYLTESLGFEYKSEKSFSLRIGTGTARQTFVLDTALFRTNSKNFGVTPGKVFRNELAFQAVANFEKEIIPNLSVKSRYAMFANYERLNNIDHRLDVAFNARISRLINVSLSGIAVYDDDASSRIQASQAFSLGIIYKYPR